MKTYLWLEVFIHEEEKPAILDRTREIITRRFSKVNFAKLGPIGFSKKGDVAKIVSFGPKGGESDIFKKNDSGLLKSLTDRFKNTLGPKAEDIIAEDNKLITEEKQLREKEKNCRRSPTSQWWGAKSEKENRTNPSQDWSFWRRT